MTKLNHQTKKTKPLALVMGRNYTTRLTLTRACGMAGCDVVLIQTDKIKSRAQKIDCQSKYVVKCHCCPEPDKQLLIDTILQYKNEERKPILIPADDYVAATIDEHLDLLQPDFLMPHADNKQGEVLRIMDKDYQKSIARSVGMPVAEGWICHFDGEKYTIPQDVKYPCYAKPQESYSAPLKNLQKRCDTKEELETLLGRAVKSYQLPYLVEEFIDITKEYGVQGVSFGDHAILPGVVFKDSSRKGLTATGYIHPITDVPGLEKQLSDFMRATHFTGIFDIDLFESNGKFYFNELNTRLGANGFALTYGVSNVPGLFVQYLLGQEDISYDGPTDFQPLSFASEKVIRDMYYDGTLSLKAYKDLLKKSDVLSLKYQEDDGPFKQFAKLDRILPLWRWLRNMKKRLK